MSKVKRIFEDLNDAQQKAVMDTNGPSLIIAGAGSGKTRVLTFRIAHLLNQGVDASSILALTFTNKAAREMKNRVIGLLSSDVARYIWMGTFHSMFSRILRRESESLGFPSAFTIYDTDDSKSLIRSIIKEMQLDDKIYKPSEILGRISSAKNNLITPQAYFNNPKITEKDRITRRPLMGDIYKKYSSRCRKAGAMDFDDLLLYTNILFRDFPEILGKYQERFKYILVDEYQDTNYSQYLIIKMLAQKYQNVCVVGDDAQSIYSFRGAQIENILNFKNDYPDCKLFKLEQNYRSTRTIVDAANSIIDKNKEQIRKQIFSKKEEGGKLLILEALTDVEEGFMISNAILDKSYNNRANFFDFAIMYRTNAQSRIFEEALRKRNIPYKVYGSISFYQRKEIRDMIAYLRLIINSDDDEALKRIINYPARGIGKTTVEKLEVLAAEKDLSIWSVLSDHVKTDLGFNKGTLAKLDSFREFIVECRQKNDESDAWESAMNIAKSSGILKELYHGNTPEERSRYENLEELFNSIRDFAESAREEGQPATLQYYVENVSLLTTADNEKEEDRNKVSIMTIHSAKGLEFKHVFIAGVEEELFPSYMSLESARDIEEERRLFYVAVTRAKEDVTISYCRSRYKWGIPSDCRPSRFLNEIDNRFIIWESDPRNDKKQDGLFRKGNTLYTGKEKIDPNTSGNKEGQKLIRIKNAMLTGSSAKITVSDNFNASDPLLIQTGMLVEHQRFGRGKVIHLEGEMPNKKATVFFQEMKQEKQLLLKFAKLRIIDN